MGSERMIEYLILIGLVSVAAMTGSRRATAGLTLLGLVYFVAIGWRLRVGMDWNNYVAIFTRDENKDLLELLAGTEPGFGLLVWLGHAIGDFVVLNIVSGAVFCLGLFAVARRCREPFLAIAVATPYLVMVIAMSATRQAIALGIIFYLFARWDYYRVQGKLILVLLATMFHFSALFSLVFVVLQSRLSGATRLFAALLVAAIVFSLIALMPESIGFYAEHYVSGGRRVVHSPGAIFHVLLLAVPAACYMLLRRRWRDVHGRSDLIDQLAIASLLALPALSISSTGVDRLSLYFWPMAMYVWAGLPALADRPEGRVAIRALLLAASAAQAVSWLLFANSAHAYIPYRNSLLGF